MPRSDQPKPDARPTPSGGGARLSRRQKVIILAGFSLFVTLLVLGLLEGGLRLAGYGGYPRTFVEAGTLPDGSKLIFTDHGGPNSYFFANRSRGGSLDRTAFVMPKPKDTVRIVIVGGSASKGNPYTRPLTAGAFLEEMLEDIWPQRDVEVINCGTTAIASFPVLGIMTEALEHEPDLVVVYAGNNEFYGAYGVASLHTAGRSPTMIRLIRGTRSLGIAQFIDRNLRPVAKHDGETLMETMVGQSYLAPDDPARTAAAHNLGTFMGLMVDRCKKRGVPVVVCTVPCNERGLAPLGAENLSALSPEQQAELRGLLEGARSMVETDAQAALAAAGRAVAMMPDHATAHYLRGLALHELKRFDEACAEFAKAVDLDPMPWRAPNASVDAIREAARTHGAPLCDLQKEFEAASEGGSISWELMADHVHASLRGQDLIARSIVKTLGQLQGRLHVEAREFASLAGFEEYAARRGRNRYSEYEAAHAMRLLGRIGFYQRSNPNFFERFNAECDRIEWESRPEVVPVMRLWQDPATHKGDWRPLPGMVGRELYRLGHPEEAEPLFRVAAESVTPYGAWDMQYTTLMLSCRRAMRGALTEEDIGVARAGAERGRFAVAHTAGGTGELERYTGELLQMCGQVEASVEYLRTASTRLTGIDQVGTDMTLVRGLVMLGRIDEAREVVERGMRENAEHAGYYRQMMP